MKKLLLILSFLGLTSLVAKAQEKGQISGTIVDAENGETIIGASIGIAGTTQGAATDLDGNYTIKGIEPGSYTIRVSYISYVTQNITDVVVKAGETTKLDIVLQSDVTNLDEITVTAEAILNNEAGLLRQRQKSIAFSDAISAESISKSGSSDAAGALKKVVGASVVGGKYVYIRGLGDRYTSSHLNGLELPSADPNKKAFQLDIFPSSLLENIVTLKTFTPDKPGNFSGGLIDVNTKDFPSKLLFNISVSNSWNSETTFENILLGGSSDTDWLGHDDGFRNQPSIVVDYLANPENENIPRPTTAERNPEQAIVLDNLAKSFASDFAPIEDESFLNQSYGVSLGNQFSLFGRDFGYIASLTYGRSYSSYSNGINGRYALIGTPDQAEALTPNYLYSDNKGALNVDIGGLVNVAYKLSDNHKLSGTYIRTQSGSNSGRFLSGADDELPSTAVAESRVIEYIQRSLTSTQLGGKHFFPNLLSTTIEWKGSYAKNTQDEPNRRAIITQVDNRTINGNDTTLYSFPNGFQFPLRFYRELEEKSYNGKIDISIPFNSFNGVNGSFKFGGSIVSADRAFREDAYDFFVGSNGLTLNQVRGDLNKFFSNAGIIGTQNNGRPQFGVVPREISDIRNNYNGSREINAMYAMIELPATDKLKLIGGARLESAKIGIISQDSTIEAGSLNNDDLLPSANFVYSLNDKMNLRGSWTKTLARPTFRELAPYATTDFTGGFLKRGNPNLERTLITNYDIRWEWFTNPGEVLATSVFYKIFENPIEAVIDQNAADGDAITFKNVPKGTVVGVEFEIKKNLRFLSESLKSFAISTNLTLVRSNVDIPADELAATRTTDPNASSTRPLLGQSDYIINADLSYENPEIGYSASLNFNKFGDRLSAVSYGATPNVFEQSYSTLDFLNTKSIGRFIDVSFSVKNILNPDIEEAQTFKGLDFINSSYRTGRTFSIGVKYKI